MKHCHFDITPFVAYESTTFGQFLYSQSLLCIATNLNHCGKVFFKTLPLAVLIPRSTHHPLNASKHQMTEHNNVTRVLWFSPNNIFGEGDDLADAL